MSTNADRIDKYELQQSLGRDGVSEAWKAFDNQARRYVTIKLFHAQLKIDPDFVTRFQQEAQAIVSLRHPNIVPCYDFSITRFPETNSATAYLVMEYLEGGTLADYNRNVSQTGKLLPIPAIVHLFSSIGMAINYAHSQHVIHGSLKPSNILLDKQNIANSPIGEPMVTDFNLTRLIGPSGNNAGPAWNSSPFYVSPEQVMGAPANELSDIYSLGVILYEICTGTVPFLGNSAESIMMQQVNTVPASPSLINPNLPPDLSAIVMRCMAKDPKERFPSALAVVSALTNVEVPNAANISQPSNEGQSSGSFATQERDMPTVISAKMSPLPAGLVASGPMYASNKQVGGISQPYSLSQGTNTSSMSMVQRPLTANTPVGMSMPPATAPTSKKPSKRGLYIVLAALLILALIGSALGAYFTFFAKGSTATPMAETVGHAYFVSSGLISPDSREGITDQVQINVDNVSPPQSGKSYYAWLLNDVTMSWRPILLGTLAFKNNTLVLFYPGDAVHSNLLATNSRFLITEEDAAVPPTSPSLDSNAWIYYAEFSQQLPTSGNSMSTPASSMGTPTNSMGTPTNSMSTPTSSMSMTSFSLYDHIRHLLASAPSLQSVGLKGGLDTWVYRNTQKILEWAGSARDSWKYQNTGSSEFIHRQLTRIMDYLDGASFVKMDLPSQGLLANPSYSKVGILTFDPQTQNPTGFLYEMGMHLHEMSLLPETSAEQKTLAIQINQEIDQVNLWYQLMRQDIMKLYPMSDAQLFGNEGRSLLDDIATLANDAFAGKVDQHAQVADGAVQIHYAIQRLATFDVRACTTSDPCKIS